MTEKREITGTVRLNHSREPKECTCCPGFPTHVFGMGLDLPPYPTRYPDHFGRDIGLWLTSALNFKDLEGRRIRVTAEVLDDEAPVAGQCAGTGER